MLERVQNNSGIERGILLKSISDCLKAVCDDESEKNIHYRRLPSNRRDTNPGFFPTIHRK